MDFPTLQSHLVDEAARLKAAAARAKPDARVPTCPEWTATDLLAHVTETYDHKIQCMRLMRAPEDAEMPARRGSPTEQFDAALAELLAEFDARRPEDLTFTWYGPDQTVGFWIRRMAAETAVHRADAELAAGEPIGPVDPALGLDGVDEFIEIMMTWASRAWHRYYVDLLREHDGLTVAVDAGERAWTIRLRPEAVEATDGVGDDAQAVVAGDGGDVLMWLWRRLPLEALTVSGDAAKAAEFYGLNAEFGQ